MKRVSTIFLTFLLLLSFNAVAADFDGDSRNDIAIFRPSTGLWAIRGITRIYFGSVSDLARPGDYDGDGIADIAVYRPSSGLWAVKGITRIYFGGIGDEAIQGGSGQRIYDYVVKPGDVDDLVAALESDTYNSVFIPAGNYLDIDETINVSHVKLIVGEANYTTLWFWGQNYLSIEASGCIVERIRVREGGGSATGNFYIDAPRVTVRDCTSLESFDSGFKYSDNADHVSLINCVGRKAAGSGFLGSANVVNSRISNCAAIWCQGYGFSTCFNLSNCTVEGETETTCGFIACQNISASRAIECATTGFSLSLYISACTVNGLGTTDYGFNVCGNLSSCHVEGVTTEYTSCWHFSTDSSGTCD